MKANTAFVPNKKLILHFDVEDVLVIPAQDKDFYVLEKCAAWSWGKFQRNNKQNPDLITGWKLAYPNLAAEIPEAELINYKNYLDEHAKPNAQQYSKLILGLSKGPAGKLKGELERCLKNVTLPKTLSEALKESGDPSNKLLAYYSKTGKYQILPAFFKLLLNLKKNKREFAVVVKNTHYRDRHQEILGELNLFFSGEHPLFNGKNGTPAVKWDGSKGTRNFIIDDRQQAVYYRMEGQLFATLGTLNCAEEEKDLEMFKQKFKSFKSVRLCEKPEEVYSTTHALLAESAGIYEINPLRAMVIDPQDYLTHQIYFTSSQTPEVYSCLNEVITDTRNFVIKVPAFDYLRDVDYFIKAVQSLQGLRSAEINRIQKKQGQEQEEHQHIAAANEAPLSNYQYLKKNLLPVLEGALKQVDLLRPEDPIGFIALYCLKNRQRLE